MHTTLKNAELLKHSKLDENAPTYFGLHRNHLQGAKVSAWLHHRHNILIDEQQANDNNPLFELASIPRDLMQPA